MCSFCPAARSTAKAISIWSASATMITQSALSRLVRLGLSLLRRAEGDPVPRRAFAPHAGAESRFHQRARRQRRQHFRPGGPIALITNRCLFDFDRARRRFRLASVHPGHSVDEVVENTGFDFDRPADVPVTPAPSAETLRLLRTVVAPMLAEVYPQFAESVFGVNSCSRRGCEGAPASRFVMVFIRPQERRKHGENGGSRR